jgi:hypothetical protein
MKTSRNKPFIFVLMPFGDEFRDVYELGIKAACLEAGANCERVDEQFFDKNILAQIYNQIEGADIIIADMTGRNPNVFYETGYAHALSKQVILLTQNIEDIPFDLKHYPHIVYSGKITSLKEKLLKRIVWGIHNPKDIHLKSESKIKIWENREKVEPSFIDRIKSTKKSLFLIGVTFESTFKDHKDILFETIKKNSGLRVKILLLHPDSLHIDAHKEFTDRRDMSYNIKEAINFRFKDIYDRLSEDQRERIEIRATHYLPRIAIRIFDDEIMLLNLYLYDSKAHNNPVFEICRSNNEKEFLKIRGTVDELFCYGDVENKSHSNHHVLKDGIFKPL